MRGCGSAGAPGDALLRRCRHGGRGGSPPGADPRLRAGRRCRRGGADRCARGYRQRDLLRHGGHLDRRLPRRRRACGTDRGARGRRLPDQGPDGRHPHGRCRRRLRRLVRPGRRASRRPAQRRRDPRAGLLRAGWNGGHGDRCQPCARSSAKGASRRARARPRGGSDRPGRTRPPRGDRGRERRDAAGAAGRLGHEERYGYADRGRAIELVAVRTADVVPGPPVELAVRARRAASGPELVVLSGATCWVPDGWAGETDEYGTLVLERRR